MFSSEDLIPEGYVKGKLLLTEETKQKLSKSHKGKHHTEDTKLKISAHSNNNRKKAYITIEEKYGSLSNYYARIAQKVCVTKKKNGSFNSSQAEKDTLKLLQETYGKDNVLTQYKSAVYPFRCDFYIKSEDLYIELNAH